VVEGLGEHEELGLGVDVARPHLGRVRGPADVRVLVCLVEVAEGAGPHERAVGKPHSVDVVREPRVVAVRELDELSLGSAIPRWAAAVPTREYLGLADRTEQRGKVLLLERGEADEPPLDNAAGGTCGRHCSTIKPSCATRLVPRVPP